MASVTALRQGLATRLATIAGLRASAAVLDAINPPAAMVGEVSIDFDQSFGRGLDQLSFKVRVYASRADDRRGQEALDAYLAGSGASSVKAAIEGDKTLGGAAANVRVERVDGYGVYDVAGTTYLGADFTVTIWATGA